MADKKDYINPSQYSTHQSVLNKTRTDKFRMVLNLPDAIRNRKSTTRSNTQIDFDTLQFTVTGSPVPDIIVPAIGQMYAGQELKISSHTRQPYENIFVSFNVDNLFRNWWVIYYWLDLLNNETESRYNKDDIAQKDAWEAMKDYTTTFTIYGLDEYNNPVIQYDYEGAFPVSLASPKFDNKNPNEIESQFEFAFTFFKATLI